MTTDFFGRLVDGEAFVDGDESESVEDDGESDSSSLDGFVVQDCEQLEEESSDDDDSSVQEIPIPRNKRKRLMVRGSGRLLDDLQDSSNIGTQVTSGMLTPDRNSPSKEEEVEDCGVDCRCGETIRSVRLMRTMCQDVEAGGTTGVTGVLLEKYRRSFELIREILGSPCFAESLISARCSVRKRRRVEDREGDYLSSK
jgi:hypothetical protein